MDYFEGDSFIRDMVITAVVGALGYLLKRRDDAQEKELRSMVRSVDLLFKKHDADSERLDKFELKVSDARFVQSHELDAKLDKITHLINEIRNMMMETVRK